MLQTLLGWPVVGTIVVLAIGTGFAVLSMTPPRYRITEVCYCVAAVLLLAKVAAWTIAQRTPVAERLSVTFLIFGVLGLGWAEAIRWVEAMIPRVVTAQHQPASPSAAEIAAEVAKRLPPQQSAPVPAATKPQLVGRVLVAQFEGFSRFYQHPPVYFERMDTALYVTMTNQTGRPLYVQGYSVAALVRGHWQTFRNLYGLGFDPYEIGLIAPDRSFLGRFDLTENGFDYVMRKRPLGTDEAVETWMFLNSGLSSADRPYITKFRITIYDSTKTEHTFYCDYPDKLPRVGPLKTLPKEPVPTNLRETPPVT